MAPTLPLQRALLTLLALTALVLTSTASAQAAIKVQPVRSFDAVEGAPVPDDRIVVFEDTGACAPGAYDIAISWGDGTTSAGRITFSDPVLDTNLNTIRCVYQAVGEHRYRTAGTSPVSVRVTRGGESVTSSGGGVARIAEAPVRGEAHEVGTQAGRTWTGEVARFADANRLAQASDYTATIDWGDGTTSAGALEGEDGQFTVDGAHAYARPGRYAVRVSLVERGAVRAAATGEARVDEDGDVVAPLPTLNTAASRDQAGTDTDTGRTLFRPALRLRSATVSRRALRRGLRARLTVPASLRTVRVAVVRLTSGQTTVGSVTVRIRGGRVADGVRQVDVRVPLSAALRRKLRAGSYALRVRIAGSPTVAATFRVTR